MFRSSNTSDEIEPPLEAEARQYARRGWHVTSRTVSVITMANESHKGEAEVRLSLDADGKVRVDGPPLPAFALDGRARAWVTLLLIAAVVFGLAWLLGFFQ